MSYYDLRFQLRDAVSDSQADALGDRSLFFDSTDGVPYVTTDVDGTVPSHLALFRAFEKLREDGVEVVRAVPELASLATLANRFNVTRQAAQRWKKAEDFPLPVITDDVSLWYWPDVRIWVTKNRNQTTFDDASYPTYADYSVFNAQLSLDATEPCATAEHTQPFGFDSIRPVLAKALAEHLRDSTPFARGFAHPADFRSVFADTFPESDRPAKVRFFNENTPRNEADPHSGKRLFDGRSHRV